MKHSLPRRGGLDAWQLAPRFSGAAISVRLHVLREHFGILLLFMALSIALSWPTVLHFTTTLTSSGVDARHNLWLLWHTQQALLSRQPLFDGPSLYYPYGISLLVHGVGPITGLFALPFWPLGPAAAYNGALLISLMLTGYCTYLLARGLGLERTVALFAGVMVQASPMCLAGLNNHITKVFLGAIPLALLALHHALNLRRSHWWAGAFGLGLLLTLLHNGYQFVFLALASGILILGELLMAERKHMQALLLRIILIGVSALALSGPLLYAITQAASDPAIGVDVNEESTSAPDLAQYILPWHESALFGETTQSIVQPYMDDRAIILNSETSVSLSVSGLILCIVAWARGRWPARRWVFLTKLCVLCSLGPSLQILTQTEFTEYNLPIVGPYAFLTGLPGLEFMRAPGRFMMFGFVVFGIAAAMGLARLVERWPRRRNALVLLAAMLVLIPAWPRPFPQEELRPVPEFYKQIASDPDMYGVFDLPIKSSPSLGYTWKAAYTSSYYQVFQITHGKGIAGGYISRTYSHHPLFDETFTDHPEQLLVNGQPAVYGSFLEDLARFNYRYVVLHKALFGARTQEEGIDPGELRGRELVDGTFAGQTPVADDQLVTVYRVEPNGDHAILRWGQNWRDAEDGWRWARSPATLTVDTPSERQAVLLITPQLTHDPEAPNGLGATGMLEVQVGDAAPVQVEINAGHATEIPITLEQGQQTITLRLAAGNFQPSHYGMPDPSILSFAVRTIDLQEQK